MNRERYHIGIESTPNLPLDGIFTPSPAVGARGERALASDRVRGMSSAAPELAEGRAAQSVGEGCGAVRSRGGNERGEPFDEGATRKHRSEARSAEWSYRVERFGAFSPQLNQILDLEQGY